LKKRNLPLRWKEVLCEDITKLDDKFYAYFWQSLQNLIGYEIVSQRLLWTKISFITVFTFLTMKDFIEIFRVTTVMASESFLFSYSKVISQDRLKNLGEMYSECFGLFFFSSDLIPVLLLNRRIMCLRIF